MLVSMEKVQYWIYTKLLNTSCKQGCKCKGSMGIFEPDFLSYVILEQSNNFMRNVWYCNFIECQDDLFFLGGQMLPVTIGSDPPLADIQSQFLMQ